MQRDEALRQLTANGQTYELTDVEALGRRVRVFKNAPVSLGHLYVQTRSDKTFLVYEDERLTFEDVWRQACTLAHHLAADHGVGKGDRVAIAMRNFPEWIVAFNAITLLGGVVVAVNALWQTEEIAFALNDSRPKVVFADHERQEQLARCQHLPPDLHIIAVRTKAIPSLGATNLSDVLSGCLRNEPPPADVDPDDDATILFTSGSTGHPKGAVSTHRNILSALMSWELDAQVAVLIGQAETVVPAVQPAALLAIPLFHVTGLHTGALASYRAQRRLICMYKWDPERAAELIESEKISSICAPPAVTGDLVNLARKTRRDLSSLVALGGGGAARAAAQVRSIGDAFANAKPFTGWGMTETNALGAGISGADYLQRPESCGRASAVLDIRVVDDAGLELPSGSRGELQVRGASIIRGYWNRPDANEATFVEHWLRTGDVAMIDEEGFLYIVDRIKDLVIRGGENIGCGAIEAVVLEYPGVIEACAYGVPDDRLGEELALTVYCAEPIDETGLRTFLLPRLAGFEIPRYIESQRTPLPRIASGKIDKRALRIGTIDRLFGS